MNNWFINTIENMISEEKEYKRITGRKLVQEIEKKEKISDSSKKFFEEIFEKIGLRGWYTINKFNESPIPNQFYEFNILISYRDYEFGFNYDDLDIISSLTFKDALVRVNELIKTHISKQPDYFKCNIEVLNDDNKSFEEDRNNYNNKYDIILTVSNGKKIVSSFTYSIRRTILSMSLEGKFVTLSRDKIGNTVYEI